MEDARDFDFWDRLNEKYCWEKRIPLTERGPVLFPGPEKWKAAALAQCEQCAGPCEVKRHPHYHPKGG